MNKFDYMEKHGYEQVVYFYDKTTGLQRHHLHPRHHPRPGSRRTRDPGTTDRRRSRPRLPSSCPAE
ncbi:MAG: hypothetical protein MZU97_04925 [Bacillus subtilis]|nr:hypothetical protein [Bacillus subtilis]